MREQIEQRRTPVADIDISEQAVDKLAAEQLTVEGAALLIVLREEITRQQATLAAQAEEIANLKEELAAVYRDAKEMQSMAREGQGLMQRGEPTR